MRRPQRVLNRLSATKVTSLLKKPGAYCDGSGLWLMVLSDTAASFVFRYTLAGKARSMGIGSARALSLADARYRAVAIRQQLSAGMDPRGERLALEVASQPATHPGLKFRDCAQRYIDAHSPSWRNPKHQAQWPSTLTRYVYPVIGDLDVGSIETSHVCEILEPLWNVKPETASRIRGRIETVLDWATARGYRKGDNPARWKGHVENLFPAKSEVRKTRHQPAMPYADIPAFVQELRKGTSNGEAALEFLILTCARTMEVLAMPWSEIDMKARVWTVPEGRMKAGREHRVPLSDRAMQILERQKKITGGTGFVFPGMKRDKPLSNMTLLEILRRKNTGVVSHGFRSSFRVWAAEQTNYAGEVSEAVLAHTNRNKVEAVYLRSDHFEKRKPLMELWAGYCSSPKTDAVVIPMLKASNE